MMTAPEGKIMSSYTETPQRSAAGNLLYNIAFGKAPFCHHPDCLSGRVTTDDNFTFYKTPELDCGLSPLQTAGDIRLTGKADHKSVCNADKHGRNCSTKSERIRWRRSLSVNTSCRIFFHKDVPAVVKHAFNFLHIPIAANSVAIKEAMPCVYIQR